MGSTAGLKILVVEDEPDLRASLQDLLEDAGHDVVTAADGNDGLAKASASFFEVVISDVQLPGVTGRGLLAHLRQSSPETSVILITGYGDVSQAVAALREGAYDYLTKPFDNDELLSRLSRVAERHSLRRDLVKAKTALSGARVDTAFVGESPPVRKLLSRVQMVAPSDSPCLITGESGTGKELIAHMLHDLSPRSSGPYVTVNCGALTETLVEAELFGHERGAFTGADRKRDGRFKAADGGTLFLDEIGELPMSVQAKLLRVLQEGTFEPLGSNTTIKVDVRVLAATHRDLRRRVREKLFREDLFYRVNVVEVALPPLRQRASDLPLLVQYFLAKHAQPGTAPTVAPETWELLKAHPYPGNVRELGHAIHHALIMSQSKEIRPEHLPSGMIVMAPPIDPSQPRVTVTPLAESLKNHERECLEFALAATQGRHAETAALLKITRASLMSKLKAHGLDDTTSLVVA